MRKRRSFGVRLWLWFVVFSGVIFIALWLLQTVFLQSFYNDMAIRGAEKAAGEIAEHSDDADFYDVIDETAAENSLLVFVTDGQGNVLYSADEYKRLYGETEHEQEERRNGNPYFSSDEIMNWEKGALRNLPYSYESFIARLRESGADSAGFVTEDNAAYVTGSILDDGTILYVSMPLGTVGGTVRILRLQLVWVSVLSLILGFVIAWAISRRFGKPIEKIAGSAREIAAGNYHPELPKGFCTELDELSDTLGEMALSLEKAKNAQREFLANVSHDLRTPLTMIRGYAEMVREISWSDAKKREQDLDIITREADRLTALVNEILEFSAMQSGSTPQEFGVIDLSRAVREVTGQFAPFCEQNGFVIEAEIADGVAVSADEAQIRRVIYNFIDNAVNHTDESKKIKVSLSQKDGSARFAVTDFGKGITNEEIPYIWDRYYTARNRKNKAAVSGLGLSIAKEILTAHKAKFGVDTRNGCTFWFELENMLINDGNIGRAAVKNVY